MMNIIGPVNETKEGYKFIFTAIDFYSKWVEAFPICDKYAAEVAACLKLIFYRHGAWKSVLSNEKMEFVEAVIVLFLRLPYKLFCIYICSFYLG